MNGGYLYVQRLGSDRLSERVDAALHDAIEADIAHQRAKRNPSWDEAQS